MASKEDMLKEIEELKQKLDNSKIIYQKPEKLKHFNGTQDVVEWVDDCRLCLKKYMTEADQVNFILNHLDDVAKKELRLHGVLKTADEVFSILYSNFGGSEVYSQAQRKFFDRLQSPGESVRDYSIALSSLMARTKRIKTIGNEDEVLRDHFISGLRDSVLRKELRREVSKDASTTFMSCRKTAIDWSEDADLSIASHFEPQAEINKIEASGVDKLKTLIEKQQKQIEDMNEMLKKMTSNSSTQVKTKRDLICYNCGIPGHTKRYCRNKQGHFRGQNKHGHGFNPSYFGRGRGFQPQFQLIPGQTGNLPPDHGQPVHQQLPDNFNNQFQQMPDQFQPNAMANNQQQINTQPGNAGLPQ